MSQRVVRTKEERVAEIDSKIDFHKKSISSLKAKKEAILNPKPRKKKAPSINAVIAKAKASGMSADDIAKKLGITFDE